MYRMREKIFNNERNNIRTIEKIFCMRMSRVILIEKILIWERKY